MSQSRLQSKSKEVCSAKALTCELYTYIRPNRRRPHPTCFGQVRRDKAPGLIIANPTPHFIRKAYRQGFRFSTSQCAPSLRLLFVLHISAQRERTPVPLFMAIISRFASCSVRFTDYWEFLKERMTTCGAMSYIISAEWGTR